MPEALSWGPESDGLQRPSHSITLPRQSLGFHPSKWTDFSMLSKIPRILGEAK